jgi:hypothetical protein
MNGAGRTLAQIIKIKESFAKRIKNEQSLCAPQIHWEELAVRGRREGWEGGSSRCRLFPSRLAAEISGSGQP